MIKGKRGPIHGWFSEAYGLKCESSVLSISITGMPDETAFSTGIGIAAPFELEEINERLAEIERAAEHP